MRGSVVEYEDQSSQAQVLNTATEAAGRPSQVHVPITLLFSRLISGFITTKKP